MLRYGEVSAAIQAGKHLTTNTIFSQSAASDALLVMPFCVSNFSALSLYRSASWNM